MTPSTEITITVACSGIVSCARTAASHSGRWLSQWRDNPLGSRSKVLRDGRIRSIKPIFVNSMQSCLKAVEEKKADACITYIGTAQYFLSRNQLANVKFAGFYERKTADESIAVRKDWPILASILQKGLDSLSESEMNAIYLKWVALERNQAKSAAGLVEISNIPAASEFSSNKDHDRPLIVILPYFFMIGYIWLWLLLLGGYRQSPGKQVPQTELTDQSLKELKCDFEQMILKRTTELNTNESKFRNLVETLNKDYFF